VPRAGLSADAVVELAVELIDDHTRDPADLTLAAVAARAGVATPSLYKHVGSLAELRSLVSLRGWQELTARIADAVMGRSGEAAVRRLLAAYRSYVVEHPNRYRAMGQAPLTDPRTVAVADRLMEIVLAVLAGFGLEGPAAVHAARGLRSAAHGFAVLEADGGFGLSDDLDASYDRLVDVLIAGLRSPPAVAAEGAAPDQAGHGRHA
jgi:AcrR family transcriptional regulator